MATKPTVKTTPKPTDSRVGSLDFGTLGTLTNDPTGWSSALGNTVDTTGMNIPGVSGLIPFSQLYQAIVQDATKASAKGALWGAFAQILRQPGNGYTKAILNNTSAPWGSHDDIALKKVLTQWSNANSSLPPGVQPWSALQYVQQAQFNKGNPLASQQVGPVRKITSATTTASRADLINNVLQDQIIPRAKALGSNLKPADLNKIATSLYDSGTYGEPNMIDKAINDATNTAKVIKTDTTTGALGGAIGTKADEMRTVANNYGIPVPQDPNQFANFVKGAVGPGGDISQFTEYAKAQALHLYPWMAGFLTGGDGSTGTGGTVAGYLQPYATNIASTLGISSTSINWTDPKWQSVVAKKDLNGVSVPQTLDQAIQTVKTDPRFGYDQTPTAKNDAYDAISNIRQLFGFGA